MIINILIFVVSLIIVLVIPPFLAQRFGRYILRYILRNAGIKIVLCGIPLCQIRYDNIELIKAITSREDYNLGTKYLTWALGNRIWGPIVFIRQRKAHIFKNIGITPDNAGEFVAEVKKYLSSDIIIES